MRVFWCKSPSVILSFQWFPCSGHHSHHVLHVHIDESRISTIARIMGNFQEKASQGTLWRLFGRFIAFPTLVVKLDSMITTHTHCPLTMPCTSSHLTSPFPSLPPNLSPNIHPYSLTKLLSYSSLQSEQWIKSSMHRSALTRPHEKPATAKLSASQNMFSRVTNDMIAIRMWWNVCYHSCLRCSPQRLSRL